MCDSTSKDQEIPSAEKQTEQISIGAAVKSDQNSSTASKIGEQTGQIVVETADRTPKNQEPQHTENQAEPIFSGASVKNDHNSPADSMNGGQTGQIAVETTDRTQKKRWERVGKVRKFCKRNKVFFDIFVAFSLSLMSFIVSYNSFKINENREKRDEVLAQPIINLIPTFDEEETISQISVVNSNNAVSDFRIEVEPYYLAHLLYLVDVEEGAYRPADIIIPIADAGILNLISITNTASKTGVLAVLTLSEITSLFVEDMFRLRNGVRGNEYFHIDGMEFVYTVRIGFTDLFGNSSSQLYIVRPVKSISYGSILYVSQIGVEQVEPANSNFISQYNNGQIVYIRCGNTEQEVLENLFNTVDCMFIDAKDRYPELIIPDDF